MTSEIGEMIILGSTKDVEILHKGENYSVYRMENSTGDGLMTLYDVFPGIAVIYSDFHMAATMSESFGGIKLFGIDYCREGRIEWELDSGNYFYLQEGDLQISNRRSHSRAFSFPLSHYHGITIGIYVDNLGVETKDLLDKFGIDIEFIYENLNIDKSTYVKRADENMVRIFGDLYNIRGKAKTEHYKLKVLELLYLIQSINPEDKEKREYFPKNRVDTVKDIALYITGNLERDCTISELSRRFDIPETSLKLCFKGVYGLPIGQYLRKYRMNVAAKLLREGKESVATISGLVGYDNQSKFAAAFKSVIGNTPKEYQKLSALLD